VLSGIRSWRVRFHRTVRDRHVRDIDDDLDVERGFECRLVEAGKSSPCVGRLELRRRIAALCGLAQVETHHLVIEGAGELQADAGLASVNGSGKRERRLLRGGIERNSRWNGRSVLNRERLRDLQVQGIQHDRCRGFGDADLYLGGPGKRRCREIGIERHHVV
jgi:hypothetical protein